MAAATYDIIIEEGADFDTTFTYLDTGGNAVDVTGFTARMKVKENKDDAGNIISLTDVSGITLGGVAGTVQVKMTAAQTDAMSFEWGVYDLEIVSGAGVVTRLVEGAVRFVREVTTT